MTPIFYKLRQNTALSRQRSRVRAPSSPLYIPKILLELAESIGVQKSHRNVPLLHTDLIVSYMYKVAGFRALGTTASCVCDSAWEEKTSDMTAAWAACFAGVIAWV